MPKKPKTLLARIDDFERTNPPCPNCESPLVTRAGYRNTKYGPDQMYRCKNCKHRFTARKIPTVIYPAKTIIAALSYFNTGHTLDKTRQYISRRFKQKVPISTLKDWTDRYTNEFPGIRLRKHYTLNPREVIRTRKLYHPQLYEFKVHSLKLNIAN